MLRIYAHGTGWNERQHGSDCTFTDPFELNVVIPQMKAQAVALEYPSGFGRTAGKGSMVAQEGVPLRTF